MKKYNINVQALFPLIIIPTVLSILAYFYINNYGFSTTELLFTIVSYYVCNITVGIGFHRLWSHTSYKTTKAVEFILIMLSAATLQGPVLMWASDHYKHHSHTDEEQDPHSPLKYSNKILGFLWSHMGWMIFASKESKTITRLVLVKLGSNKLVMWQFKNYWAIAVFMNFVFTAMLGYLITGNMQGAAAGIIFMGIGRAIQQQATFLINSLCHFFGSRKYSTNTSGDIWWLAPFLLGENWHNYHHAFPMDYRNGFKWYQFDVHKWIIYLMSKIGLAWDLNRTSDIRINAKMEEKNSLTIKQTQVQWNDLQTKAEKLKELLSNTATSIENSSYKVKSNLEQKIKYIQTQIAYISEQAQLFVQLPENSSAKLLKRAKKELVEFESFIKNLVATLIPVNNK